MQTTGVPLSTTPRQNYKTSTFIVKHEQSSAHNEVSEKLTWVLDVKHRYGYHQNVIVWVNK
jgi:hypothetical protein